jgi:hypothetical protein
MYEFLYYSETKIAHIGESSSHNFNEILEKTEFESNEE